MRVSDMDGIIPIKPLIQYHEFDCYQCGFHNRFVKPDDFIDYKKEWKIEREIRNNIIHELNELMAFSELHYSLNPSKDKLIEMLTKLREKYS